jgi:hypothetical protein
MAENKKQEQVVFLIELIRYFIWYLSINWKNMLIKRIKI